MGSLIGFFVGLGIMASAWSGDLEFWGIGVFVVAGILGILLFPNTVGTFMTSIMFMSPIAIVLAAIRGNSDSVKVALGLTACAWLTQIVVGTIRKGSVQ